MGESDAHEAKRFCPGQESYMSQAGVTAATMPIVNSDMVKIGTARRRHAQEYLAHHREVDGWLEDTSALVTAHLLEAQTKMDLRGNMLEIGVHHGRYFLVLATALEDQEYAVAVDVFDDQSKNTTASGRGNWSVFIQNVARFAPLARVHVVNADSSTLGHDFVARFHGMRCVSIDGGHDRATTCSDLRLAERLMVDGGIVALDDIYRPDWSGVTAGLARYFHQGGQLVPMAFIPNKLLLTTSGAIAETYREILRTNFGEYCDRHHPEQEFFEFDNVLLVSADL